MINMRMFFDLICYYVFNMYLSRFLKMQVGVLNWFQVYENKILINFLVTLN
jgi:hypothetical protein